MRPEVGAYVTREVRLEALIGEGGMGSVWLARDAYGREAAVKFISEELADDPVLRERFAREARAAQSIPSPHVVRTLAYGTTDDGTPYLMMELCRGESLRAKVMRTGRLGLVEVASIVEQVGAALEAAHGAGIVHRDVKPENVFLVAPHGQVKVLDFGIAKREARDERVLTQVGMVMGTPEYMSPEQLLFPDRVEAGFDLWATAVVAYEALTGALPFAGDTPSELLRAVCEARYAPPSAHGLPDALDAFFAACFSNDPQSRPLTARELTTAFAAHATSALALPVGAGAARMPTLAIELSALSGRHVTRIGPGPAAAPAPPSAGPPARGRAPSTPRLGTMPIPLVMRARSASAPDPAPRPEPAPRPTPAPEPVPPPRPAVRTGTGTDRMQEGAERSSSPVPAMPVPAAPAPARRVATLKMESVPPPTLAPRRGRGPWVIVLVFLVAVVVGAGAVLLVLHPWSR
ncbi:MAG: serine/threonine protein kinase [Polyangiaceae bacterium]|nr:serine/threonine protein kinase [Polyangiaceae bacterium]